jgi:hypothetical protein
MPTPPLEAPVVNVLDQLRDQQQCWCVAYHRAVAAAICRVKDPPGLAMWRGRRWRRFGWDRQPLIVELDPVGDVGALLTQLRNWPRTPGTRVVWFQFHPISKPRILARHPTEIPRAGEHYLAELDYAVFPAWAFQGLRHFGDACS